MERIIQKIQLVLLVAIGFVMVYCARPGSPGGGPKDTQPPQVIKHNPPNYSAHFKGDRFEIDFDEFIELNNINQSLLISPPMDELPDFKAKGKTLLVKFNEELKENTTYTLFFGDAIVDITEKNPVTENTYIFSTGDRVDSMSMEGKVINAIDLQPAADVFVMLYKVTDKAVTLNDNGNRDIELDSMPMLFKPFYLSKTNENGQYKFNGLADEKYLIFALRDLNSNHIFDQPTEEIAFLDSLVTPAYSGPPQSLVADSLQEVVDSLQTIISDSLQLDSTEFILIDSLMLQTDSIVMDSTLVSDSTVSVAISQKKLPVAKYDLILFTNRDSTQRMLKGSLLKRNTLEFSFSLPARSLDLIPVNYYSDSIWYLEKYSKRADTITWYLKDIPVDTLELVILDQADTLEYLYINLNFDSQSSRSRVKKKDEEKKIFLEWTSNTSMGKLLLNQKPTIVFEQPIASFNTESGSLIIGEDTTYQPKAMLIDSFQMTLKFPIELQEATKYSYYFPDSSFIDWNGYFNKEIRLNFETKTPADYGKMTMIVKPEKNQPYVLQMLNAQDMVVKETFFNSDTSISYKFVSPAKYKFKVVFDDNGNGKWDSGYYPDKIQPEKIIFFNKEIDVRANWEIEEAWQIK
ncbi:MAG: Ig-like domain-containing protein [Bacteroidetes bacterium]|nr:Ig-like domain-containing protein [Bacteroidota bacterium]